MDGNWSPYPVFIPVNIIGDTAIDGMRAMAGYDYLWVFLWWLAGWLAGCGLLSPFGGCLVYLQ